jgi:hypothetical protein
VPSGRRPGDEQIGVARLTVTGDPITDLSIAVGGGAKVIGRVVFEGATPALPIPSNPDQFRVSFTSVTGTGCRLRRSVLGPDWTFTVDGLLGTCLAQVTHSAGLTVKAVIANGTDLMERPMFFESGQQLRNVDVIVSNRRTDVTFQVADERGQPTREYVALVFAVDKSRWVDHSRYIRAFVPQPSGVDVSSNATGTSALAEAPTAAPARRDSLVGLPTGDYYVVALDDLESEAVDDPVLLDHLSHAATRIRLTDTTATEVILRRLKLPERSPGP